MAKEDNLIPFTSEQNREEAKINGRKGGIRSGEVRREKATMRKTLELMLDEIANIEGNEDKLTYRQMATIGLLKGAILGNSANYKTILETTGELIEQNSETPSVQINIVDNSNLEKTLYEEE